MAHFLERVVGAMLVRPRTFEDVEHDPAATGQAAIVVAAQAVSAGILAGTRTVVLGLILGLIGWAVSAFVLLLVGTRLLPGRNTHADYGQMLRTLGFAQAVGIFSVLTGLPTVGWVLQVVLWGWVLMALVVAVRQALDYERTRRAVAVCLVAWPIMFVVSEVALLAGLAVHVAKGAG